MNIRLTKFKHLIFSLLRRMPMPVIAIVIGLAAGFAVWGVLDQIQSRAIKKIFGDELQQRLDLGSRESLLRFNQYLTNYAATTRLLANHRRLSQYLEPLFWFPEEEVDPVIYEGFRPLWLPDFFERNALLAPSHVALVDTRGRIREIYQAGPEPLPAELLEDTRQWLSDDEEVRPVLIRLADRPYLLVSDRVADTGGYNMGRLMVLVPIDAAFLAASNGSVASDRSLVALIDPDEQRILATDEPGRLALGSMVDDWTDSYLITRQSLPAYEGSNWNMLFATFVPRHSIKRMSRHTVHFERRQRVVAALVFIGVFTLVIYLVSARLNKVLVRMSSFSQRALGIEHPSFSRGGNQLLLLEEWIQQFTQLVLHAREEMRRKHESEMRQTEALKAAIMEASLDAIITLNRDGRMIDCNPTAEQMFGFDAQQALNEAFAQGFVAASDASAFEAMLGESAGHRIGEHQTHVRGELNACRADGMVFPIELSIVPIDLEEERFYTLYIHDITKRKQAEREIRSLARFASESPNPILRASEKGEIVYANVASKPLMDFWNTQPNGLLPEPWCETLQEALGDGNPREREADFASHIFSLLFVPIQDLGYVNVYARDITAVRRAEQESRQHQAELVHVCRLSTMGEVATGMAHELNQPLSAIVNYAKGASRRLQGGMCETEPLVAAMSQISSQAERAGEIIRRLRALVGKQPPIRSRVDLNYLVREVCGFVEFDTERLGVALELDLAAGEIPVDVDLVQIEQVLLNLIRNALDALAEQPADDRLLRIATRTTEATAIVSLTDSGPGIPTARMQRLFDPFFTTKDTGMGMGLPISQTILDNHDGRIWAESNPGQGACFSIQLPVAPPDESEAGEDVTAPDNQTD
ncbi:MULTISPECIES: PAS domain-containing sensor histidine kinase [Thiorhodovibrio]|uniref:PAS domain-containing sensor histidine kinase n=1 Tax=Thiorhodovibrio TaxID=61593 RepID=UPI00389AFB88|nr:PAS domain-containing sensor histidine kinase [Thiorhodovibrio winogradskyi]WPL12796.1 Sensor protein FixL [Thiorhodovibrio litoralis]